MPSTGSKLEDILVIKNSLCSSGAYIMHRKKPVIRYYYLCLKMLDL